MSYREIPINAALGLVVGIGQSIGLKQKVEISDHTVSVELTLPDQDTRAWDKDHFRHSNVFMKGYANPIKPVVRHHPNLEEKDTVHLQAQSETLQHEANQTAEDEDNHADEESETEDSSDDTHVSLISSSRYRDYMRQDLVSQLLTPQEQWKLIAYGILALGMLLFLNTIIMFWINGGGPA